MRQRHQPFAFEEWLDGLLDELACTKANGATVAGAR
jgi:hypothetical protein